MEDAVTVDRDFARAAIQVREWQVGEGRTGGGREVLESEAAAKGP